MEEKPMSGKELLYHAGLVLIMGIKFKITSLSQQGEQMNLEMVF